VGGRTLILDTHVAIWIGDGAEISAEARRVISRARHDGTLYLSAISAWEIATLVRKQRFRTGIAEDIYIRSLFTLPGIQEAPVTAEIARIAGALPGELHGDPADRIIIATASVYGLPLATRDRNIVEFAKRYGGFSCVAA
jgi:PIN domain nuclease of toxin-antitoxin system